MGKRLFITTAIMMLSFIALSQNLCDTMYFNRTRALDQLNDMEYSMTLVVECLSPEEAIEAGYNFIDALEFNRNIGSISITNLLRWDKYWAVKDKAAFIRIRMGNYTVNQILDKMIPSLTDEVRAILINHISALNCIPVKGNEVYKVLIFPNLKYAE